MRTARVFISSTFNDFRAERDVLHALVFPKLEALCREHGCSFQAIDLRWGIAAEDGDDYATLDICLNEIRRCARVTPRPNFIFLAGDRYGWRPLPTSIPGELADRLLVEATADERAALLQAYATDYNATPPELRLVNADEKKLRLVIDAVASRLMLTEVERALLGASATQRELVERADLCDVADSAVFAVRTICNVPHDEIGTYFDLRQGSDRIDEQAHGHAQEVKELVRALVPDVLEYARDLAQPPSQQQADLEAFAREVQARLTAYLESEFAGADAADDEARTHEAHAEELRARFVAREAELAQAAKRAAEAAAASAPLVVTGPASCGKTFLLAELARRLSGIEVSSEVRFAGLTAASTETAKLLDFAEGLPADVPLLVDGVELCDKPRRLVEGLVAMRRDAPLVLAMSEECLELCARYVPDDAQVMRLVPPRKDEVAKMVGLRLSQASRSVSRAQGAAILDAYERTSDLHFIEMLTQRATTLASFDGASELANHEDAAAFVASLLDDLTARHHFGTCLVRRMLAYLCLSRAGLSDKELYDLLGRDAQVWDEFEARSRHTLGTRTQGLPYAYYSRALYALLPLLSERTSEGQPVYRFASPVVEQAARERMVGIDEVSIHAAIADYFLEGRMEFLKDALGQYLARLGGGKGAFLSRFAYELPGQLAAAGRLDELYDLLCDQAFLAYMHDWGFQEYVASWAQVEDCSSHTIAKGFAGVLDRARAVVERGGSLSDADETCALYLSDLLGMRGGYADELALLSRARAAGAEAGSSTEVQAWYHQVQSLLDTGKPAEALSMARERQRTCPDQPSIELCYVLYVLGQALFRTEAYDEAKAEFEQYLAAARAIGARDQEFIALKWVASCEKALNHQDAAMALYRQLEDEYGEDGDLGDLVPIFFEAATSILMSTGDSAAAKEYFDRCEDLCNRLGNRTWLMQLCQTQMFMANVTRNDRLALDLFPRFVASAVESDPNYALDTTHLETYVIAAYRLGQKGESDVPDGVDVLRTVESYAFLERCGNVTPKGLRQSRTRGQAPELYLMGWELAIAALPECLRTLVRSKPADYEFFAQRLDAAWQEVFPRKDVAELEAEAARLAQGEITREEASAARLGASAVALCMAYAYPIFDHVFETHGRDGAGSAANYAKIALNELVVLRQRLMSEITYYEFAFRYGTYLSDLRQLRDQFDAMHKENLANESEAVRSLYEFFSNQPES